MEDITSLNVCTSVDDSHCYMFDLRLHWLIDLTLFSVKAVLSALSDWTLLRCTDIHFWEPCDKYSICGWTFNFQPDRCKTVPWRLWVLWASSNIRKSDYCTIFLWNLVDKQITIPGSYCCCTYAYQTLLKIRISAGEQLCTQPLLNCTWLDPFYLLDLIYLLHTKLVQQKFSLRKIYIIKYDVGW